MRILALVLLAACAPDNLSPREFCEDWIAAACQSVERCETSTEAACIEVLRAELPECATWTERTACLEGYDWNGDHADDCVAGTAEIDCVRLRFGALPTECAFLCEEE